MPKKINDAIIAVVEKIAGSFDIKIDAILARHEFNLTAIEKIIFFKRIKGIIAVESRGNINVKNGSAGEIGIMQIKPVTAASVAKIYMIPSYDLKAVDDNLLIGSLLLYDIYIKSDHDIDLATQRYNQGWVLKTNLKSLTYLSMIKEYENYA